MPFGLSIRRISFFKCSMEGLIPEGAGAAVKGSGSPGEHDVSYEYEEEDNGVYRHIQGFISKKIPGCQEERKAEY